MGQGDIFGHGEASVAAVSILLNSNNTSLGAGDATTAEGAMPPHRSTIRMAGVMLILSHGMFFAAANWFFSRLLYRDYEVKARHVQVLFAITFTASASMFELLLLVLAGMLQQDVFAIAWKVDQWTLVVLAYAILPASVVWTGVRTVGTSSRRVAAVTVCLGLPCFWYMIFLAGQLLHLDSLTFSADALMARIGALGITVVAMLSGFGAVNFPFSSVHSLLRPVTQQQVADTEQRLLRTMNAVAAKKRTAYTIDQDEAAKAKQRRVPQVSGYRWGWSLLQDGAAKVLPTSWGLIQALASAVTGDVASSDRQRISTEIEALEALSRELFMELHELVQARGKEKKAKTTFGKVLNVFGCIMSAVCFYKIATAFVNLLLRRGVGQGDDPATRLLNMLLVHMRIPLDVSYWVPVLSLVFVGWLTFMNTRQFIQRLLIIFRWMSTSVTSNSLALVFTEVMTMYFVACVLLSLRFVPKRDRAELCSVIGEVDLTYVHMHFDYVFLLSSLCTLAVFGLSAWLKSRTEDSPHDD
mmetsp:Transcript_8230/g.18400  ORF Transcript_8230/g.18400 Transcript_8230/m.18400 type:complete len:526 (+) Transcript_8230:131-1708(+)